MAAILRSVLAGRTGFVISALMAMGCAVGLEWHDVSDSLPGLGAYPLLPAVAIVCVLGLPLLAIAQRRITQRHEFHPTGCRDALPLLVVAAALSLPPILIDLISPFPRNLNLPLPSGLFFYPAVSLVAEVAFHLLPIALLSLILPKNLHFSWILVPVAFIEPAFQLFQEAGWGIRSWLVFGSVSLVSAAQLWLFWTRGFGAMISLRLAYYLFWHVLWGEARLSMLFQG